MSLDAKKKAKNQTAEALRQVLDNRIHSPTENVNKKEAYQKAIDLAKRLFQTEKLDRLRYDDPDEPKEAHILYLYVPDTGDFVGSEIELLCNIVSLFDYVTFEVQDDTNQIMIACMINDIYVEQ